MTDQPVKEAITLEVGDKLTKTNGGFAEVLSVEHDREAKKAAPIGYNISITEPDKPVRTALVLNEHVAGFLSNWHLQEDAGREDDEKLPIRQVEFLQALVNHLPVAKNAATRLALRGYGYITQTDDWEAIEITEPGRKWLIRNNQLPSATDSSTDEQLRADLADANALIEIRDSEIERLKDQRDDAIEELSAASNRAEELTDDLLHQQIDGLLRQIEMQRNMVTVVGRALGLNGAFVDDYGTGNMIDAIEHLTEQLAEARAKLAAPAIVPGRPDTLTPAPVKEFEIVRDIKQIDMDKREKDGWQIQYMQFADNAALNVVYFRYTAPVEPLRTTVAAVGPQVTIIPNVAAAERPTQRAQREIAEVFELGKQVYEAALAASPIPTFRPLTSLSTGEKS